MQLDRIKKKEENQKKEMEDNQKNIEKKGKKDRDDLA